MTRRRKKVLKARDPQHTYLCPNDIYIPAQAAAEDNQEPLSDVIRRCLIRYTETTARRTGKNYRAEVAAENGA